ncbi:MAG: hypothetical protein JWR16_1662 [Nevskia sp.]|nr:hypothetical protein [Nevskia sp.]
MPPPAAGRFSAQTILGVLEPLIYGRRGRPIVIALLIVATLLLAAQALRIRPDAGFEKSIPLDHPYMQVYRQYRDQLAGANTLLIALESRDGDIYNDAFLRELRAATQVVGLTPGIDRTHLYSLVTPNVRYVEVVNGGLEGGDVVPREYAPTAETFAQIQSNVAKAGLRGWLVSIDQHSAMISAEVLERDPASGRAIDLAAVADAIEDGVRGRFRSATRYAYKLKRAHAPFAAGAVVAETFHDPRRWLWLRSVPVSRINDAGELEIFRIPGRELEVEAAPNPQYRPDVDLRIIGFTKVVGDVTDAAGQVLLFFVLTVVGTMLALCWYLGSVRLALLPLVCSLVAVVWEFGLLRTLGYGADPFAIMVPFLVLAVSTSHGIQYVNTWADQVVAGASSFEASRSTFRRLFIPGSIALVTNVAGFLTIALVPIGSIREMSLNACLGMLAVIVTNKIMMPIWLSGLRLRKLAAFRKQRQAQLRAGERLWQALSVVTEKPVAIALLSCAAVVLAASLWVQQRRVIGDAENGVPELRSDSIYNQDARAISRSFAIGIDQLVFIAETDADACVQYEVMEQIEQFRWHLDNVAGVQATRALTTAVRQSYATLMDGSPKFNVLPRNRDVLVVTSGIPVSSGLLNKDCSVMPVTAYTTDHRATTIAGIVAAAQRLNRENAEDFFSRHPEVDAQYCAAKSDARRQAGLRSEALKRYSSELRAHGASDAAIAADTHLLALTEAAAKADAQFHAQTRVCPVNFASAYGNVGVMAATNEVVKAKELTILFWVYAVIALLILLSYRSFTGLLTIGIPLLMVSVFANALMDALGIGLKVATLPVVSLAVGIGVDYGIYIYDLLQQQVQQGLSVRQAYVETLRRTGKAVIFTGVCLTGSVASWIFSDLQFQRDMGELLVFMFAANMLGAVLLAPALFRMFAGRRA